MPSSPEKLALLDSVPDWGDWTRLTDWINQRQELESSWQAALTGGRNDSNWISLEWNEIATPTLPPFGYYSSPLWRKFVTAAYFADLCSYPAPDDQVSFERLLFVMHAFPQGFKVWFFAKTGGPFFPVGYTGWYPMAERVFIDFENCASLPPATLDRCIVPKPGDAHSPWIYLFNYSVAAPFHKTRHSRQLIQEYAREIQAQNYRGLACINVSPEGARVAQRFGMTHAGSIAKPGTKEGSASGTEEVYTLRN